MSLSFPAMSAKQTTSKPSETTSHQATADTILVIKPLPKKLEVTFWSSIMGRGNALKFDLQQGSNSPSYQIKGQMHLPGSTTLWTSHSDFPLKEIETLLAALKTTAWKPTREPYKEIVFDVDTDASISFVDAAGHRVKLQSGSVNILDARKQIVWNMSLHSEDFVTSDPAIGKALSTFLNRIISN